VGVWVFVLVWVGVTVGVGVDDGITTISATGTSLSLFGLNTFMVTYIYKKILNHKHVQY